MNVKYLEQKEIPYFHQECTFQEKSLNVRHIVEYRNKLDRFKMDRLEFMIKSNPKNPNILKDFIKERIRKEKEVININAFLSGSYLTSNHLNPTRFNIKQSNRK